MQQRWLASTTALIFFATCALADVTMHYVGPSGSSMGGVYTSPYTVTINNGAPISVICDDFNGNVDTSTPPWLASVTNLAALVGGPSLTVKFDHNDAAKQQMDYTVAAYLASELTNLDQSTASGQAQAGYISFAIWDVFDPGADKDPVLNPILSGAQLAAIGNPADGFTSGYLYDAIQWVQSNGITPANFSASTGYSVDIYTPTPDQSITQEFFRVTVVTAPEPPGPALLAVYLSGLLALILCFRKRTVRGA